MISRSVCALVGTVGLMVQGCSAAELTWVGSTVRDNQWTTKVNWSPNDVPGPNDDVKIDLINSTVILNAEAKVRSLHVGKGALLTVYHDLDVSAGLTVDGVLLHDNGLQTITANATISGTWDWHSGEASGSWQIEKSGTAKLDGLSERTVANGTLDNYGTMTVQGVLGMNTSGRINNYGSIAASGNFTQIMAFDSSPCLFNSTGGSLSFNGKVLRIMSHAVFGPFDWRGGAMELFGNALFSSDVVYTSSTPSYLSCQGAAQVTFGGKLELGKASRLDLSARSVTIGSGSIYNMTVNAGSSTVKNITAEHCSVAGGAVSFSSVAVAHLVVKGGTLQVAGDSSTDNLDLTSGIINGKANSLVAKTVNVNTTTGIANNVVHVTEQGNYAAGTVLGGGLNVGSGAVVTATGGVMLRATQYSVSTTIDGTLAVDSGSLNVNSVAWQGKGKVALAANAEVNLQANSNVELPLFTLGSGAQIVAKNTNFRVAEIKFSGNGTVSNSPGFTMTATGSCFDLYIPGGAPHTFYIKSE